MIILVITISSLLFVTTLNLYYHIRTLKENLWQSSELIAIALSVNLQSLLEFSQYNPEYKEEAGNKLKSLESIESILNAVVYDQDSAVFAVYASEKAVGDRIPRLGDIREGFTAQQLNIVYSIHSGNNHYGTLYLRISLESLQHSIFIDILRLIGIIAGIVLVTIVVAFKIQGIISEPIVKLEEAARRISEVGDYSIRVNKITEDEIGNLYDSFNNMLEQIHFREIEKNRIYQQLESSENRYKKLFDNLQYAIDHHDFNISRYLAESENDDLAVALRTIMHSLEKSSLETERQNWLKTGQTELSVQISGRQNIADLCSHSITYLSKYLGVQLGVIYIFDEEERILKLKASYAYKERKGLSNQYSLGEGLVGQAALEKEMIIFTDIPDDYIKIESGLGCAVPKHILIYPLVFEDKLNGVIELASTSNFTTLQKELLGITANSIAVAINSAQSNYRLEQLLQQTQIQSDELNRKQDELGKQNQVLEEQTKLLKESEKKLQQQTEELQVQQEGLRESNDELARQTRVLKESETILQRQQEELQVTNEELEEKTRLLEEQKEEIVKKNEILKIKQKELEEKAEELQLATKYKSEFLANMSHELRTPLNSMLLLARMLAENDENNLSEDQIESAQSIHRSGQNLLNLINDILDLAKIEARKIELSITRIRLSSLASDIQNEFKHSARDKGLDFIVNMGQNLPEFIITDSLRLNQIVRNFLSNAFKFTENGSITVDFHRPGLDISLSRKELKPDTTIAITVTDTGTGIPADKQRLIFEAFQQVDGSISRRYGGTGLGLSISKELAQLIGCEIKVTSEAGKGTSFTLVVPEVYASYTEDQSPTASSAKRTVSSPILTQTEPLILNPKPEPISDSLRVKSGRIMLIIEDDAEFSKILERLARKRGYDCLIAPSGETGIQYALKYIPSAIILDIGLPGIDGWKVLDELKNNADTRHIPIHIISAFDKKNQGLQRGAIGYLTKPVNQNQLEEVFKKIEQFETEKIKELLIVEDDRELRESIIKLMKSSDVNITAIGSGLEAYNLLKNKNFSCVILDLGLPDISGFELLDRLSSDTDIPHTPIIIFTGRDFSSEELAKIEKYDASIVLKNAASMERLLDETALFLHRVESDLPDEQRKMIRKLHDSESVLINKKVMIVDDDMRNAFALAKFLKSKFLNPIIANNGQKALDLLELNPDTAIVLMDVMMPVMDGYTTMKKIRGIEKFKNLPILALTAKAMEIDRDKCIESGANDYLSKPIDVSKLLSMLRIWICR